MKTTTSLITATIVAALASSAMAQIIPDPVGAHSFQAASATNAASYASSLGSLYYDSNGMVVSGQVNSWAPSTSTLIKDQSYFSSFFRAEGGTVKIIFLGESAGSMNDFGYISKNADYSLNTSYKAIETNIENNNGFIQSGYEAYVNYGAGEQLDFWLNNPGNVSPFVGGAYFAFGQNDTTAAYAAGDSTYHVRYDYRTGDNGVTTEYVDANGMLTTGKLDTLVVAFEDLRLAPGQGDQGPVPADGDYTDFVFAFQFLPSQPVPEPSTYGMIGAAALLGLVGYRRFKAGKAAKA